MIEIEKLSFAYSRSETPVLREISCRIEEGEFILIVGKSGCGKSTLCRALNGLVPHFYGGTFSGKVSVDGLDTRKTPTSKFAGLVGMVFQDPENQLVMTNVENELAFGMENLAVEREEMRRRVTQFGEYFNLKEYFDRFIPELSGGEKQKVALASVLAMNPKYIVLDEPTSQLDTENATLFLEFLARLNGEMGVTIILVEHRLERCLRYARRVIFMEEGRILFDGGRDAVERSLREKNLLADFRRIAGREDGYGEAIVEARNVHFSYGQHPVLNGVDLTIRKGELVAITGANGSGKTTLIKQLNGLLRPESGSISELGKDISKATTASLASELGYLGQNPNDYLFEQTLRKELEFTLSNLGVKEGEWDERIEWTLSVLDLARFGEVFPRDLSCGERERTALASILVGQPRILILDEPTRGLDYWNKIKLGSILESLRREGMTTVLVTHDYRFIAEHATRVLRLEGGKLSEAPLDWVIGLASEGEGRKAEENA